LQDIAYTAQHMSSMSLHAAQSAPALRGSAASAWVSPGIERRAIKRNSAHDWKRKKIDVVYLTVGGIPVLCWQWLFYSGRLRKSRRNALPKGLQASLEQVVARSSNNSWDFIKDAPGPPEIRSWQKDDCRLGVAITNKGLQGAVAEELLEKYGHASASLGGRLCFPWSGAPEGPVLHGASRVVSLFLLGFTEDLQQLRSSNDLYSALEHYVRSVATKQIRSVLSSALRQQNSIRPLLFTAKCRVNKMGSEKLAFGADAEWTQLKTSIRNGIKEATGWTFEARSSAVEVPVIAFIGEDHLAIGVEAPEPAEDRGVRFPWIRVPRPGMETQLAGAMAVLAVGKTRPHSGVFVDLTCGMGTLLLAVARLYDQSAPILIGRDSDQTKIHQCKSNFSACSLDSSWIKLGDAREPEALADISDGSVDAVLCDLPCGAQYKAGADHESYAQFLAQAARILRPGGRCVLLSTRRNLLARAASHGPWKVAAHWRVGRGEGNIRQSQLVALERLGDQPQLR